MGEIADDIIDGACCALCMAYFVSSDPEADEDELFDHGYPVVCESCWTEDCGYQKTKAKTIWETD